LLLIFPVSLKNVLKEFHDLMYLRHLAAVRFFGGSWRQDTANTDFEYGTVT